MSAKQDNAGNAKGKGILYVCATPIGNLSDITLRALNILKSVDVIAAEDTRITRKLLNHYGIRTQVVSFHEHSPAKRLRQLLQRLERGEDIALVTNAGTPCICDPGVRLVQAALSAGCRVVPIPGPSALTAALSICGMPAQQFVFLGFLPRRSSERQRMLMQLKDWRAPIVIYEAPHRIVSMLRDVLRVLGNRALVVAREMTKQFEEIQVTTVEALLKRCVAEEPKGEFTLVIEGASNAEAELGDHIESDASINEFIRDALQSGKSVRDTARLTAERFGLSHRDAYQRTLAMRNELMQEL